MPDVLLNSYMETGAIGGLQNLNDEWKRDSPRNKFQPLNKNTGGCLIYIPAKLLGSRASDEQQADLRIE